MLKDFRMPLDAREFSRIKELNHKGKLKRIFCVKSEMMFRITLFPEVAAFINEAVNSETMMRTLIDLPDEFSYPADMYKLNYFDCDESHDLAHSLERFLKKILNFELGVQLENVYKTAIAYVKACWSKPPYSFLASLDSDPDPDSVEDKYTEIKLIILHRIVALYMGKISEFLVDNRKSKLTKLQKLFLENYFFINGMLDAGLRMYNAYPDKTRAVMSFSEVSFKNSVFNEKTIKTLKDKIGSLRFKIKKQRDQMSDWFSLFLDSYIQHLSRINIASFYEYDPVDLGAYIISPSAEVISSNVYTELTKAIPFFFNNRDFKEVEAQVFYGCSNKSMRGELDYCLEYREAEEKCHWTADEEYEYADFGTIMYETELPSHIYLSKKDSAEVLCITSYNGRYYCDFFKLSADKKSKLNLQPVLLY